MSSIRLEPVYWGNRLDGPPAPAGLPIKRDRGRIVVGSSAYSQAHVRVPGSFARLDPLRKRMPICALERISTAWFMTSASARCVLRRQDENLVVSDEPLMLETGDLVVFDDYVICRITIHDIADSSDKRLPIRKASLVPALELAEQFADLCMQLGLAQAERLELLRRGLPKKIVASLPALAAPRDRMISDFIELMERWIIVNGERRSGVEVIIDSAVHLAFDEDSKMALRQLSDRARSLLHIDSAT